MNIHILIHISVCASVCACVCAHVCARVRACVCMCLRVHKTYVVQDSFIGQTLSLEKFMTWA